MAVPLGHSEFGVVETPHFSFAADVAEEVEIGSAGDEEPFHRIFGRGVKEPLLRVSHRGFDHIDVGVDWRAEH